MEPFLLRPGQSPRLPGPWATSRQRRLLPGFQYETGSVHDLKLGMKVTAMKRIEDPQTEISSKTVITGKGAK